MAESEQQQTEQQNTDVEGSGHDMQARAIPTFQDHQVPPSFTLGRIGDLEMWILLWLANHVQNLSHSYSVFLSSDLHFLPYQLTQRLVIDEFLYIKVTSLFL